MTTQPLSIAVAGCGRIGRMHAALIAQRTPDLSLAAVTDVFPDAAAAVAGELGVEVAASFDEILASDVDAVAICTSTDTHVDLAVAAAEAGKAIFLEKPVSLNLAEIDRCLAAVDASGVPMHVGFNRRFDPAHGAVGAAVREGKVGDVHMVRITSRDPEPPPISYVEVSGGIFVDMTIHDFDMARFVTGSDVVEVFARAAVRVDPAIGEAGDVDTAVIVLTHENGAITTIDNSRQAVYGYDQRVEVFGSGGMVVSENPRSHTTSYHGADASSLEPIPWFFLERYTESYLRQWTAFVDGVRTGEPAVTGRDGRAPLVMGIAAQRSLAENRPVRTEEIA